MAIKGQRRLLDTDDGCENGAQQTTSKNGECAKNGKGTFASSAFTVFNSAVGTGILTLPYSIRVAGIVLGATTLLFFTVVMGAISCMLVKYAEASGAINYQSLVKHFGGTRASAFMSGVIAVYCFFATVGGLIIVGDVTHPILVHMGVGGAWWAQRGFPIASGAALAFPLMCLRDITSLRFSAMCSFAAIMYVVCIVVWHGIEAAGDPERATADRGPAELAVWSWKAFIAVPNIFLSLQCQIQVPSIFAALRPELKTTRTMTSVIASSHVVIFTCYLLTAFFGYYTFRAQTPTNIMSADYDQSSAPILIARVFLAVVAICSIPINHFPARSALHELLGLCRGEEDGAAREAPGQMSRRFILLETSIWFVLMLAMGITIPNLDVLNDILGTTAGVSVIFLLPGLLIFARSPACGASILALGVIAFVVSGSDFIASTFFSAA